MTAKRLGVFMAIAIGVLLVPSTAEAAGSVNTWSCSTGDSASGCSSSTLAAMPTARSGLGSTMISADGHLYALDGRSAGGLYSSATQLYAPASNTWTTDSPDVGARTGAAVDEATVLGTSYVYAVGGYNGSYLGTASYFTPGSDTWTTVANLPTARAYLGTAMGSDGLVYAVGGQNASGYLSTVEAYSPTAAAWYCSTMVSGCTSTSTPPKALPTARANLAVVAGTNGLIYTIGGQTAATTYSSVVEAYNPSTRTWDCSVGDSSSSCSSTAIAPMPTARDAQAGVTSSGLIFVVGGNASTNLSVVEVYNPNTNTWACSIGDTASGCSSTVLTPLPTPRAGAGVTVGSDGQIDVVGGNNGSYLSTLEAYNPPTTPGTPTAVSAVAGSATATVSWTAPSNTGGMPITGYTVSCTPACTNVTVSSGTTTAVVTGLTNVTSYTFTVVATNFVGSGSGTTSSSVTPASCTAGTPSVSGAVPGTFAATLNGSNQTAYASLTSYLPSDNACGGWNVTFQATRFSCTAGVGSCPTGGDSLPTGSLLMAPPIVSCNSGTSCAGATGPPNVSISSNAAIDSGTAVKVASASVDTGDGSYTLSPGTIFGAGTNLSLAVPSYAYASTYNSTVTVSIVSGP